MKKIFSNRAGCLRIAGIVILVLVVAFIAYRWSVLPWMNTWGATANEINAALPGDE